MTQKYKKITRREKTANNFKKRKLVQKSWSSSLAKLELS